MDRIDKLNKKSWLKKILWGKKIILQRDFLKTRFSRCMLYRHNAAIGKNRNLVFWDNSLYLMFQIHKI